ncbi:Rv3235 family protein [Streptomyces cavernicola]|uniref:Rv3235 family protein n=1 Tax=Streptomyces cavernicola TaxID=3043613 RepID=A0ABT6SHM1_9ACTN|nr:Rv3235 family protein [Streptomyces sp. B-S-A6]MDI3407475.1 Rv3235 family protein [Streptomyces sp. B-S-A6]
MDFTHSDSGGSKGSRGPGRSRTNGGSGPGARALTRPGNRRDQRRPAAVPAQRRRFKPHELFAERLLAVLSGDRPVHWMLNHTVGRGYQQLVELAPHAPFQAQGPRPVVRTCRALPLSPGVVEASACIGAGDQVRAMAFRLERGVDLRWRCAAVELGGERQPA